MNRRNSCPAAVAWIHGGEDHPQLWGKITFTPCRGKTLVTASVNGLPASETGFFGFHIHEGADCREEGFPNTKGHYNPQGKSHPAHAGDLPPLLSCRAEAYLAVMTDRFDISEVIGRTVVIHSHPDDFRTQPSGDSGSKIACGVICRM